MPSTPDQHTPIRATVQDWPTIWPLWHEVVAAGDTYVYDPATNSDEACRMWLGTPGGEVWMHRATASGRTLGVYRISPNHAGPGSHVANGSYMVGAATRGRGIGRLLVLHSLRRAAEIGYLGIQFNAVAATNVSAVRLYLDVGFDVIGTVPGGFRHPVRGLVDLLIMYRDL